MVGFSTYLEIYFSMFRFIGIWFVSSGMFIRVIRFVWISDVACVPIFSCEVSWHIVSLFRVFGMCDASHFRLGCVLYFVIVPIWFLSLGVYGVLCCVIRSFGFYFVSLRFCPPTASTMNLDRNAMTYQGEFFIFLFDV